MVLSKDWEFDVLGVYNYRRPGKLDYFFKWLFDNHASFEGDVVEFGVFRGATLLSVALFLKELGSEKKIYGFDSFAGFPDVKCRMDDVMYFFDLKERGQISDEHFQDVERYLSLKKRLTQTQEDCDPCNISSSGSFSDTSKESVLSKARLLELDNVVLVDGAYSETLVNGSGPQRVIAAIMDCDLYRSYMDALNYVYPLMAEESPIYLDEYYSLKFPGARSAVNDFLSVNGGELLNKASDLADFERWYLIKARK